MKLVSLVFTCAAIALLSIACTETTTTTNAPSASRPAAPAAASPTPTAPVDEMVAAGAIYAQQCESCHGPTGEGGPVKVDNKQIKVPSLKANHAIKHTDDELIKIVTDGEEAMPAFKGKLKPEEITLMVRFVRKNFQATAAGTKAY